MSTFLSNDDLSDTEEILVFAEFEGCIDVDKYRSIHVLGINETKPVLQADDTFFTGKFENPLGTYMFFEEDLNPQSDDPLFDKFPEKSLKYLCKTHKFLHLERAYVTPREGTGQDLQNQLQQPQDDVQEVHFKTLQDALEQFKNEWCPSEVPKIKTTTNDFNININTDVPQNNVYTDIIKNNTNITDSVEDNKEVIEK